MNRITSKIIYVESKKLILMKMTLFKSIALSVIVAFSGCLCGCNEEPVAKMPELTLTSGKVLSVGSAEARLTIGYQLLNGSESGKLALKHDAEWITDVSYDVPDEISFTVTANSSNELREAAVTVEYSDEKYSDSETLNIVQSGMTVISFATSSLEVKSEGGSFEIPYTVVNESDKADFRVSERSESSLILDNLLCNSEKGVVTFDVDRNVSDGERNTLLVLESFMDDVLLATASLEIKQGADQPSLKVEVVTVGISDVSASVTANNDTEYMAFAFEKDEFEKGDIDRLVFDKVAELAEWADTGIEDFVAENSYSGSRDIFVKGLKAETDYKLVVCGVEVSDSGDLSMSVSPAVADFKTLESNESDCTFEIGIENSGLNATVNVKPDKDDVRFIFDIVPEGYLEEYEGDIESKITSFLTELLAYYSFLGVSVDYITSEGESSRKYIRLDPSTLYYAYASSLDDGLVITTTTIPYEEFNTTEDKLSNVNIDINCDNYFNGDDVIKEFQGFDMAAGNAVIQPDIHIDGEAEMYFYYIFEGNITDEKTYPDQDVIDRLEYIGYNSPINYVVPWDTEFTVLAIAMDSYGYYGKIFRQLNKLSKDGALSIDKFDSEFGNNNTTANPCSFDDSQNLIKDVNQGLGFYWTRQ